MTALKYDIQYPSSFSYDRNGLIQNGGKYAATLWANPDGGIGDRGADRASRAYTCVGLVSYC